jgi:type II secretory pathway predicted ATPase ExeA/septal ring-binding cell division protein DamX
MYYAHFGLAEAPFRITPNTEVFFAGANRGAILDALIYAITQGEGIVKVTGEVGTGKTMLCSMMQSRLPANVDTVYLAHPSVSPEEILHAIAFELQLPVTRDSNRMEVMQALYACLLQRHAEQKQVVIFIEESQNMPLATLEEVRLLSNLETGKHKLLQIVLFGQPELDENLRQPNIRQLRERITHSFTLPPLTLPEVGDYLMFRLRAVGYRGPDLFSPGVVKQIAQASQGLTRRINLIADKALLAAFSENTHTVDARHVAAAIRDSEFARDNPPSGALRTSPKRWLIPVVAATVAALAVTAFFLSPPGKRLLGAAAPPASVPTAAPATITATPAQSAPADQKAGPAAPADPVAAAAPPAPAEPTAAAPARADPNPAPAAPATVAREQSAPPTPPPGPAPEPLPPAQAADVAAVQQAAAPPSAAPTPKPAAPPRPLVEQGDMLDARLASTRRWLETAPPQTLTIQLLGAENPQQLREHLSTIAKSIEISNLFVYRTIARQKPFLSVLYGSFSTREAAQNALDRLPTHLKAFRPYLRSVQGIREEMSRNNTL